MSDAIMRSKLEEAESRSNRSITDSTESTSTIFTLTRGLSSESLSFEADAL